jgi:hypothetical protein
MESKFMKKIAFIIAVMGTSLLNGAEQKKPAKMSSSSSLPILILPRERIEGKRTKPKTPSSASLSTFDQKKQGVIQFTQSAIDQYNKHASQIKAPIIKRSPRAYLTGDSDSDDDSKENETTMPQQTPEDFWKNHTYVSRGRPKRMVIYVRAEKPAGTAFHSV